MGKQIDDIPDETLDAFEAYDWPGNIRELQNVIERAIILSDNGVLTNPLLASPAEVTPVTPAGTLMDSERTLILQTLQGAGWVIGGAAGAAAKLGLKRTTLFGKMKKLGISRPDGATNLDRVHGTGKNRDFRPVIQ